MLYHQPFQIAGSLVADSEWSQMLDLGLDAINLGLSIITASPCLKGKWRVVLTKHWGDVAPCGVCISFLPSRWNLYSLTSDGPEDFFFRVLKRHSACVWRIKILS